MYKECLKRGGVAVVTGAANGVGFAAAQHFLKDGLDVVIADLPGEALEFAANQLKDDAPARCFVKAIATDVSDAAAVQALADQCGELGETAVLMNNAGVAIPSKSWDNAEAWRRIIEINMFGVVNGIQAFLPKMIEANRPAVVVNTGSKQGITTPPGNPAYNVSKAAVKVVTEMLAHDLREAGAPISAHLFVPGFTYTSMIQRFMPEKPAAAWTSEEAVDYFVKRMEKGDFYILCPDNDVSEETDQRRVEWAAADIIENRPALSRWHPDYSQKFSDFEKYGR